MWLVALLLGVTEGLTEFVPVSSTGHLILVNHWLGFSGTRAEVYTVFIQLAAILAVVWEYRGLVRQTAAGCLRQARARRFVGALGVAFVPAAVAGFVLHGWIAEVLFGARTVAWALLAGAGAILLVEALPLSRRTNDAREVTLRQALLIGIAQCVSLWPGFSRSAATILGGLLAGLERRAAVEFSFFLAIPTMGAASLFDLAKNYAHLERADGVWLPLAFVVAFVVAWASIRWLLRFVATHTLRPFAWYRIALGILVLLFL